MKNKATFMRKQVKENVYMYHFFQCFLPLINKLYQLHVPHIFFVLPSIDTLWLLQQETKDTVALVKESLLMMGI